MLILFADVVDLSRRRPRFPWSRWSAHRSRDIRCDDLSPIMGCRAEAGRARSRHRVSTACDRDTWHWYRYQFWV